MEETQDENIIRFKGLRDSNLDDKYEGITGMGGELMQLKQVVDDVVDAVKKVVELYWCSWFGFRNSYGPN